jgi:hypothetical protein
MRRDHLTNARRSILASEPIGNECAPAWFAIAPQ